MAGSRQDPDLQRSGVDPTPVTVTSTSLPHRGVGPWKDGGPGASGHVSQYHVRSCLERGVFETLGSVREVGEPGTKGGTFTL